MAIVLELALKITTIKRHLSLPVFAIGVGLRFLRIAVAVVMVPMRYLLPVVTVLGSSAPSQNMLGPITLARGQ